MMLISNLFAPRPDAGRVYVLVYPDGLVSAVTVEWVDGSDVGVEDYDDARGEGGGEISLDAWRKSARPFPGARVWETWRRARDGTPRRQPDPAWWARHGV